MLPGLDLNKSADILHAAYDDACGITAKFNKNILHRINSELGADFDLEQFEHHVVYDEKQMRVGMYLKSMQRQTVSIPKSGIRTVFEKDEMIHTENSFKYTPDSIKLMLSQAGLKSSKRWLVCLQPHLLCPIRSSYEEFFKLDERWMFAGFHAHHAEHH